MMKLVWCLIVVVTISTGCQSLPVQPITPAVATPTLISAPGSEGPTTQPAPSMAASPTVFSTARSEVKPITPTTSVAATPTLPVIPGPDVKPAIDKNFNDSAEVWCQAGSHDFGDFFCRGGELHIVAKGQGNIATTYADGNFKNFILQAQMSLSPTQGSYLGVEYELLTPEVAAQENMTGTRGALVGSAIAGSPAATAGLNTGDVIIAINGKPVDENHDLRAQVFKLKPNDEITLTVVKGTAHGPIDQRDVKVKLGERPTDQVQGAYGVAFRGNHEQMSFYIFMLYPDGEYQLMTWSPGSSQTLIPWTESPAIKHGAAVNLLQVIALDKNLTLFVNGQQLASIQDDTYQDGVIGPVALEEGHAVVKTFKVWELP